MVVTGGETVSEFDMAFAPDHPPDAVQGAVADGADQVRVADPPTVMEVGATESVIAGAKGIEIGGGGTAPEESVVKEREGSDNAGKCPAASSTVIE